MKFDTCQIKLERRPRTPRQLANLELAVRKENDAVPLFPSLRRFTAVEQRAAQLDATATAWRRARSVLRNHPNRAAILARLLDILHTHAQRLGSPV